MQQFVRYWMPAFAWMLLIFVGSTDVLSAEHTSRFLIPFLHWLDPQISMATIATIHVALRKFGHLSEYAILAALLWRGLRKTFNAASKAIVALGTFLLAAAFAASDEFHQSFVPTRTASVHDVMIDCIGALAGLAMCWLFWRRQLQRI